MILLNGRCCLVWITKPSDKKSRACFGARALLDYQVFVFHKKRKSPFFLHDTNTLQEKSAESIFIFNNEDKFRYS